MSRSSIRNWVVVSALLLAAGMCPAAASGGDGLIPEAPKPSRSSAAPPLPSVAAQKWKLESLAKSSTLSALEYGTARSDHAEIAEAVAFCDKRFSDPLKWSPATRVVLLFELGDSLGHEVSQDGATETGEVPLLTSFQLAALSFSDKLSRDRLIARHDLDEAESYAFWYQVATIVLGSLATLAIGVRALVSKENNYVAWYSFIALLCSALGTMAASINTFGDYHSVALRSSRTLAQLQQLHWRVASDVMKSGILCSADNVSIKEKSAFIDYWRDRYEAVQDASAETLARPGNLASARTDEASSSAPDPDAVKKADSSHPVGQAGHTQTTVQKSPQK